MIKGTLLIAAVTLAGAAYAGASNEPSSFGTAQQGTLKVISGVVLSSTQVSMQGGWWDRRVSCTKNRKLKVSARISISAPGATRSTSYSRSGSFVDINCAEGGPGVGYSITARKARSACPDGSWEPATYSFMTTTIEPTRKLKAVDSFVWTKSGELLASRTVPPPRPAPRARLATAVLKEADGGRHASAGGGLLSAGPA